MEAKVPQRIDMEDRIIGPLTLTQFFYLLFGGLFIYLLNSWTLGSPLRIFFYLGTLIIAPISLAFAFLKIQDRPFAVFVMNVFQYISKPRQRTWQKSDHARKAVIVPNPIEAKAEAPHKEFDRSRVIDLAKMADTPPTGQSVTSSTQPAGFWNETPQTAPPADNLPNLGDQDIKPTSQNG